METRVRKDCDHAENSIVSYRHSCGTVIDLVGDAKRATAKEYDQAHEAWASRIELHELWCDGTGEVKKCED